MFKNIQRFVKVHNADKERAREYFKLCMSDIDTSNLDNLRKVCMYISIVYVFMLALAVVAVPGFKITFAYWLVIPLLVIYYFINRYIQSSRVKLSTHAVGILCGAFYYAMCLIFMMMDVVSFPNSQALWTPLAIVVFPMLYNDKLYKYGITELVAVIAFCILSYSYKDTHVFIIDAYTIMVAYILSMLAADIVIGVRSREGLAIMELKRIGSLDKLTRVLNKDALLYSIENYYGRKTPESFCAMCIIDLDDFKHVNDNLGHNTGDLLLERVGQLLRDSFRAYDIIGRYGGDEFVVLMPDMADISSLEMRCRTLQMMLVDFSLGNGQPFTVSIGAIIDKSNYSSKEIFRIADDALYMSKLSGKNCCTTWVINNREYSGKPIIVVFTKGDRPGTSKLYRGAGSTFDIISTRTDKETLSYVSQYHNYIKIILLEMDIMDDFEMVVKYIKTREGFADIPVLAVAEAEEDVRHAKELGVDDALMYSTPEAIFVKTIRNLIGV